MTKSKNQDLVKKDDNTVTVTETTTEVIVRDRTLNDLEQNKASLEKARTITLQEIDVINTKVEGFDNQIADLDDQIAQAIALGITKPPKGE